MKILTIDDNQDITNLVDKVLTAKGYDVMSCNGGREGLELIKKNVADVILLDLAMPEFSGYDVISALILENTLNNYNIVLFTASTITDNEIDDMIKKGVKDCLRKPLRIDEVISMLNKFA